MVFEGAAFDLFLYTLAKLEILDKGEYLELVGDSEDVLSMVIEQCFET